MSNIPYEVKWTELKDLFRSKVGDIVYCEVYEKDGRSLGTGTIEFKQISDAERSVEIMHQYELGGRKLSVRMDSEGYKTKQAKETADMNPHSTSAHKNNAWVFIIIFSLIIIQFKIFFYLKNLFFHYNYHMFKFFSRVVNRNISE